jgi:hypothetical protein
MTGLETLTLILQGVIPLTLIGLAARPHRVKLSWSLDVTAAATYLIAIVLAGLWLALPRELALTYAVLLVGAAAFGTRGERGATDRAASGFARAALWARGAVVVALVATSLLALAGRRAPPGEPLDLAFPLSGGTYLVAAGGSNELLNPHLKTATAKRYSAWRGQTHAVDIVAVGTWGSREGTLSPDDPAGFAIFDDRLTSPCSGTVVTAVDGHPDRLEPGTKPATLEGNHVILECGDAWVVLGHLRRGSVCVGPGDLVHRGDPLGRVGNSGRSDEPHLHIHAQTPGSRAAPLGGDPIPVTFDGRYLVRNDRVHAAPQLNRGHTDDFK